MSQAKYLNEVQHQIKYHRFHNTTLKLSSEYLHGWNFMSLFYYYASWCTYMLHIRLACILYNANILNCAFNLQYM